MASDRSRHSGSRLSCPSRFFRYPEKNLPDSPFFFGPGLLFAFPYLLTPPEAGGHGASQSRSMPTTFPVPPKKVLVTESARKLQGRERKQPHRPHALPNARRLHTNHSHEGITGIRIVKIAIFTVTIYWIKVSKLLDKSIKSIISGFRRFTRSPRKAVCGAVGRVIRPLVRNRVRRASGVQ